MFSYPMLSEELEPWVLRFSTARSVIVHDRLCSSFSKPTELASGLVAPFLHFLAACFDPDWQRQRVALESHGLGDDACAPRGDHGTGASLPNALYLQ